MSEIQVAFFDTKPYDRQFFDAQCTRLGQGLRIQYFTHHLSSETAALAEGAQAVCAFVNCSLDEKVIQQLEAFGVRLIAMRAAGYNNVDLKAAYGKIHVVRVPAYSPYAVAEHALALMMTLNRKIHKAYSRTRDSNFSLQGLLGFDMHGKTAGVIGTGQIGKVMIRILTGLGMKVLAFDVIQDKAFQKQTGMEYVPLDELYQRADVITLHCPLNKTTFHLLDAPAFSKMKDGVMVINTGRGKLIETQALIESLKTGKVGFAGLDVYEEESEYFFEDFSASGVSDDVLARLLTFPNVIVTSHQAFFTREALGHIADTTIRNILGYFREDKLENEICYQCGKDCVHKKTGRCF